MKNPKSRVSIVFGSKEFDGWVTVARHGRKSPAYRLWYVPELRYKLEQVFLMSFIRDIEGRLRKNKKKIRNVGSGDVEKDIPFWEFLDIEYNQESKTFLFTAYYTVKPSFPELFKHFVESPVQHRIEDELGGKGSFRIYKTPWKPRDQFENEPVSLNVLYMLIDTERKLLYVGEAANLIDRLRGEHASIRDWNFYRYDCLPPETAPHRKDFERMLICDFAALLRRLPSNEELAYRLVNARVDRL